MKKIILLVVLSLCFACAQAEPELKGTPAELSAFLASVPKTVTITGEAEMKIPADRALISLSVVTENKSLQDASHENQELRGRILRTLTERGIPAERIKASKFSSTPQYGMFKEKAKSYRVENVIKITAHDEKEFQIVASLVDSLEAVRYEKVEFEHSEKNQLKDQARAKALEKANEKRKFYEDSLGVKLVVKGFAENVFDPASLRQLPKQYSLNMNYSGNLSTGLPVRAAPGDSVEDGGSSFDELIYNARVTVEYAVEN